MRIIKGSVGFVRSDDQLLLLQRNHEPFKDKWDGLQGMAEFGESPLETIRREVEEESGLVLTQCDHRGHLLLYNVESELVIVADLFVATAFEGTLRGSTEGDPVWVPLADVPGLDLIGFVKTTLPLVLHPDSFLMGTIRHLRSGDPVSYDLAHHLHAESRCLVRNDPPLRDVLPETWTWYPVV